MNNEPLVRLRKVKKSVPHEGGRLWLLRQIDLDVPEGDFVSITGPSGAGKSTLLNILGMLDHDWHGEYWLGGAAIHGMRPRQRQTTARSNISFIFQHYHLLDDLTVTENLDVPLSYQDVPAGQRKARVADMLDRFGIVGKKDLYPRQLSGGQQQLVAVARALITQPRLLLADEPTGALHSAQGEMIMDLLCELNAEGATIIQVTHDETCAVRGQRVLALRDGWPETPDGNWVGSA